MLRTAGGYGSVLPIYRMTCTLARQEEDYDPRKDPNYKEFSEKQCVKDDLYDEERKYLETENLRAQLLCVNFSKVFTNFEW